MSRRAARRDANEAEVIKALRKVGAQVYVVGLPVDLLVAHRGVNHLVEVKDEHGRLTKAQEEFMAWWPVPVHVVRSPAEAVAAVLGKEAMR